MRQSDVSGVTIFSPDRVRLGGGARVRLSRRGFAISLKLERAAERPGDPVRYRYRGALVPLRLGAATSGAGCSPDDHIIVPQKVGSRSERTVQTSCRSKDELVYGVTRVHVHHVSHRPISYSVGPSTGGQPNDIKSFGRSPSNGFHRADSSPTDFAPDGSCDWLSLEPDAHHRNPVGGTWTRSRWSSYVRGRSGRAVRQSSIERSPPDAAVTFRP